MCKDLEQFFKPNLDGYYKCTKSNEYKLRGVSDGKTCKDDTRKNKAYEQSQLEPVPLSEVYFYINNFLELIRKENGFDEKNVKIDTIKLGDKEHIIMDNGIIIREKEWKSPKGHSEYNKKFTYDEYDEKYDVIKDKFDLERVSDILWFKFTNKGHLAVVAKSCDINWNKESSCGLLVNAVAEEFDESFVFVFPLTKQMIRTKSSPNSKYRKYTSEKLELAVGNYLIYKGIPIIDFYSHMGYRWDINIKDK